MAHERIDKTADDAGDDTRPNPVVSAELIARARGQLPAALGLTQRAGARVIVDDAQMVTTNERVPLPAVEGADATEHELTVTEALDRAQIFESDPEPEVTAREVSAEPDPDVDAPTVMRLDPAASTPPSGARRSRRPAGPDDVRVGPANPAQLPPKRVTVRDPSWPPAETLRNDHKSSGDLMVRAVADSADLSPKKQGNLLFISLGLLCLALALSLIVIARDRLAPAEAITIEAAR